MKKFFIFILVILVALVSFYGGMKFKEMRLRKNFSSLRGNFNQEGRTFSPRAGFLTGTIISKDNESFTIKTERGETRVVFLTDQTKFLRSQEISKDEIQQGQRVMVNGRESSNNVFTAQLVQLLSENSQKP